MQCSRLERAEQRRAAAERLAQGQPLRQVATEPGIARSTLRDWCAAAPPAGLPAEVAACLATPAGVGWLHRLVVVGSLPLHATLGSGGRPALTGSGLAPDGSQKEVSDSVFLRYRPPLPGFAWRNGITIKAGGASWTLEPGCHQHRTSRYGSSSGLLWLALARLAMAGHT